MAPNFMIYDNFYSNPLDVRNFALSLPFTVTGNFPGARTESMEGLNFHNAKTMFETLLRKKISWWPAQYNTSFQYTTEDSKTWIHYDDTDWAAVLYLTPDAPLDSGTAIYMHNETKIYKLDKNDPKTDMNGSQDVNDTSKWTPIIQTANIFNRLIIYRGNYYHRSVRAGFGKNQFDGRLFQTFFFNTED
jgi:hypothetical protein